ncbi:SDR family oxidoreductase [soil metagenome]
MELELKPLEEQTLVITGGSSGIGLVTAKRAAKRGARLVLAARSKRELKDAVKKIEKKGGTATYVTADVADAGDVEKIEEKAIDEYGGFDTWINNAGVSIYGRIEEVPEDDARRLFDVNYWGVVHGCAVAVPYLREMGGAIINLGSVASDRAIPLQGHYSASKHAVKGFTDALRMELEEEDAPISVTLIKPAGIDTPYPRHARSFMDVEPQVPAPVYSPKAVAKAILEAAERPVRDVTVGGGGRLLTALGGLAPRLTDRYMERNMFDAQRSDEPVSRKRKDTLYKPRKDAAERGDHDGYVFRTSAYTQSVLHPGRALVGAAVAGLGIALALNSDALRGGNGGGSDGGD